MNQFTFILSSPRTQPKKHLIRDDSQGPDIALGGICLPLQQLRCHVYGTPDTRLKHLGPKVIDIFGESEVCDLIDAVVKQYIGGLEVSVDHFLRD